MSEVNTPLDRIQQIPAEWLEPRLHQLYGRLLLKRALQLPAQRGGPAMMTYLELLNLVRRQGLSLGASDGVQFGATIPAAGHGLMGQAAVSAQTLEESLLVLQRFTAIRNRLVDIALQREPQISRLVMSAAFPLGELGDFVLTGTATTLIGMVCFVVGDQQAEQLTVVLPQHYRKTTVLPEPLAPLELSFSSSSDIFLELPTSLLEQTNITADPIQYRLACQGCEEELRIIGGQLAARVKALVGDGPTLGWPTLDEVATRLHMSSRTLTRKLKAEQTGFGEILAAVKADLACWYLRNARLPVAQIAELLGYRDVSNFSRTFRNWTGETPSQYRARQKSLP